ncbi:hypothetical protein [Thermococcus camini]|nr:hypothetical protein [Thermococcus camini]
MNNRQEPTEDAEERAKTFRTKAPLVGVMEPVIYPLTPEKVLSILDVIEDYGVISVDVDNAASILDDMLYSNAEKLQYARRILDNGNVDKAVLVVRDRGGVIVIKMENVVEIRVAIKDYSMLIEDFALNQG